MPGQLNSVCNDNRDGWDNDEWGSLEEEPNEEIEEKSNELNNHHDSSRSNSNSHSHSTPNNNLGNHNSIAINDHNEHNDHVTSKLNSNWDNYETNWNEDEFEPLDEPNTGKKIVFVGIFLNNFHFSNYFRQQNGRSTTKT